MGFWFKMTLFAVGFDIFKTHITIVIHLTRVIFKLSLYEMNNKTNLLEDYVNFDHSTKKQNTYFTRIIILFVVNISLFLIFLFFKHNSK